MPDTTINPSRPIPFMRVNGRRRTWLVACRSREVDSEVVSRSATPIHYTMFALSQAEHKLITHTVNVPVHIILLPQPLIFPSITVLILPNHSVASDFAAIVLHCHCVVPSMSYSIASLCYYLALYVSYAMSMFVYLSPTFYCWSFYGCILHIPYVEACQSLYMLFNKSAIVYDVVFKYLLTASINSMLFCLDLYGLM
jgi:hypothetical protein